MRRKGSLIVKEIIGNTSQNLQLSGSFTVPFPIKEVFDIRHVIHPIKTVMGKKGIAYFGKVNFKVYCVNENDLNIHLVENHIHFRGFAFYAENSHEMQPALDIKAKIQDTFIEGIEEQFIKLFALLHVDITFTQDKELDYANLSLDLDEVGYGENIELSTQPESQFEVEIEPSDNEPELIIHDLKVE